MIFVALILVALVVSAVLRFFIRLTWLAVLTPLVLFIAFVLVDAYVLPYRGGIGSLWPLAIMVGGPAILAGSVTGVLLVARLRK
jgi:hypothetical protein